MVGIDSVSKIDTFARERALAVNRAAYEWDRLPGLPAFCKGLPDAEKDTRYERDRVTYDLANSIAIAGIAALSWGQRLRRKGHQLEAYEHLRPRGPQPSCSTNWRTDKEFARQRLNGVNPLQIRQVVNALPGHFRVTDERVQRVLPAGVTLAQLRDQGRLFICDWPALEGVPVTLGRFLTAPTALFWVDETGTLMPLAIQLDREKTVLPETGEEVPPLVFTPADEPWLWLTARTHVQSADAAYHETVVHLLRTHLVMETVWVSTNRAVPPQHPIHELLAPHFHGTISINHKARTELLVPGGPIDSAISVGTDGAYWLINQASKTLDFSHLDPVVDLNERSVDDQATLGQYYYRDDAKELWHAISDYTAEVLRVFYPDDATVAHDDDLQAWANELTDTECGGLKGLPLVDGRFQRFDDLHHVVRQVLFTVSAEHSAVNNGQYDIFGCIPNAPGALFLPHPTSMAGSSEGEFTYALPPFKVAEKQIFLVHLLSAAPLAHLGNYPPDFFYYSNDVRLAVDRFRKRLDGISIAIAERNVGLESPYTYLDPATVAVSVCV